MYSDSNNNFVTKILKKINNQLDINVVDNEVGSPTNVNDLAQLILNIIPKICNDKVEIYHFSNTGFCSRYDFANKINKMVNGESLINIENIAESKVNRPKYSVLDSNKLINQFDIKINKWQDSLYNHLYTINNKLCKNEI